MLKYVVVIIILGASCMQQADFCLGLEAISPELVSDLRMSSIALVTNHTGKDQQGRCTPEVLTKLGLPITMMLVPEHGLHGNVKAGETVCNGYSQEYRIPVVSLYDKGTGRHISQDVLKDVATIIVDMQESGMRHYTYISTLAYVMRAACEYHKRLIILDRPNPLGGIIEGPLVDVGLESFIGAMPVPLRHGMTIGELALYYNKYVLHEGVSLTVVPMRFYNRSSLVEPCLVKSLSPNITTVQACYGYSFLGILGEVRPCKTGLHTDYPFQFFGLSHTSSLSNAKWRALAEICKQHAVDTHAQIVCTRPSRQKLHGLRLHIKNPTHVRAFSLICSVLLFLKSEGISLTFSPLFDKAVGTELVRRVIEGTVSFECLRSKVNAQLLQWYEQAKTCYLYDPIPCIVLL